MANELIKINSNPLTNERLSAIVNDMRDGMNTIGRMAEAWKIDVAKSLAIIDKESLYKDDGFESTQDFATRHLGMGRANYFRYIRVGIALNNASIPAFDANGNPFSIVQLYELASFKDVKAMTSAVENGELSAEQTAADFIETAKNLKPARKKPEKKEVTPKWVSHSTDVTLNQTKDTAIEIMVNAGWVFVGEIKKNGFNGRTALCFAMTDGATDILFEQDPKVVSEA